MNDDILEIADRKMPHSIEAERAVIACLLQDNSKMDEVLATISYDMFYSFIYRAIFASIVELRNEGTETDKITVRDQAITTARLMSEKVNKIRDKAREKEGITESTLSDEFFADMLREIVFTTNVMSYCHIIREKYILREAIRISSTVISECRAGEKNAEEICNIAQDDLYKLITTNADKSYVRADSLIGNIFDDIETASKAPGGITGVKTSYAQLDSKTSGFQKTDMIVLAGRPGMGKTTFALNLAYNICEKSNASVAFFSLEMTDSQLVKKILANLSGVQLTAMRSGKIGDEGMNDLTEAARRLYNKKFFINDDSFLTIPDLRNKCIKIKMREGLDIVFIDYLQLMHAGTNYRNSSNSKNGFASRQEEIAEISRNIKGLAKDLDVPIIALSQLSREVESRKDQKPQLSDLRESGAIEQDADIVMFLSRPQGEENDDRITLTFAKHRNGSLGDISFRFDKSTSNFSDWDNTTDVHI